LQVADLYIPRKHVRARGKTKTIATREGRGFHDVVKDHPILGRMDLVKIAKDLARGGWAARELRNLRNIEVNPDRLSGRPTIRGRRVSAEAVANIAADEGWETLRAGYSLSDAQIKDAVRWWAKVQDYQAAA
jgi:uncharacterized protein (DUF433 family)